MKMTVLLAGALLCAAVLGSCRSENVPKENGTDTQIDTVGTEAVDNELPPEDEMTDEKETEAAVEDALGLTMTAKDVSRTGMKLVFTQSGGDPNGELYTGSHFRIEKYNDGEWSEVPYVYEGEPSWTMEAWGIPLDGTAEYPEKWIYYCGILPNGTYRIAKDIDDFRQAGDFDKYTYYAGFEITDETPCAAIKVGGVIYENRGEVSTSERTCGTIDGMIETTAAADTLPCENNQSNFGEGFGYQLVSDTQTDVLIGSKWYAFTAEKPVTKEIKTVETVCPLGEGVYKTAYPITAAESDTLNGIIGSAAWLLGASGCESDFVINLAERSIYYHSESGTLDDKVNGRFFTLSDEDRGTVNMIVLQYAGTKILLPDQTAEVDGEMPELCGLPRKEDMEAR